MTWQATYHGSKLVELPLGISISKIWYVNVVPKDHSNLTWISQISICSRSYLCKTSIFQACETTNGNEWIINAEAAPPSLIRKQNDSFYTNTFYPTFCLIAWLIDWLTDWLIDCLIDWLLDWFVRNVPFLIKKTTCWQNPKLSKTNTQPAAIFSLSQFFRLLAMVPSLPLGEHIFASVFWWKFFWENVHHSWESNSKGRSTYSKILPDLGTDQCCLETVS